MNSRHVLITGATGFIGVALCRLLDRAGYRITALSRQPAARVQALCGPRVKAIGSFDEMHHVGAIDAIVNLAGESIAEGRWTDRRRELLRDSRIELTRTLCQALGKLTHRPDTLISGSAIGFYGEGGDAELREDAPPGDDFAATLCLDWERAARQAEDLGLRVCTLRTGVVLDPSGGALKKMLPAFRMGVGGRIGNGSQWMSWIDREDICRMILFLLEAPQARGPWNGTAPQPVTNQQLTRALGKALHRPTVLAVPGVALKLALGEASSLLLGSQRVIPTRAMEAGFEFRHETLESALAHYFR